MAHKISIISNLVGLFRTNLETNGKRDAIALILAPVVVYKYLVGG